MKRLLNICLTLFSIMVISFFARCKNIEALENVQYFSVDKTQDVSQYPIKIEEIEYVHHVDTVVEMYGLKGSIYNVSEHTLNVTVEVDYYDSNYNFLISSIYNQDIPSHTDYDYLQMEDRCDFNVTSIAYYTLDIDTKNASTSFDQPSQHYSQYKNYDYVIDSYGVDIIVGEDNVLKIKETINAYFFEYKHGIYRVIPLKNKVYRLDGTTSVVRAKVSDIDVNVNYQKSIEEDLLYLQLGSRFNLVNGTQTYVIEYEYNLGKDIPKNYDELYFNIIGPYWETVIGKVDFKITMPKDFDSTKLGFSRGNAGSNYETNVKYLVKDNVIEGYTLNLNSQDALTIRIELNEGYFVNASLYKGIWGYILYAIPLVLLIVAFILWYKFGRDDIVTEVVSLYPPRGYNSLEIGFYYKGEVTPEEITSLIVYLANKGYLKIVTKNENEFNLVKLKEYDGTNEYEKILFNGIFTKKKKLTEAKIDKLIKDGVVSSNVNREMLRVVSQDDLSNLLQQPASVIYKKLTKQGQKEIFCDTSPKKTLILLAFGLISTIISLFVPLYSCYMGEALILGMIVGTVFGYCGIWLILQSFTNKYSEPIRVNGRAVKMSKLKKKITFIIVGIFMIFIMFIPWFEIIRYVPNLLIFSILNLICVGGITVFQINMTKRNEFGRQILGEIKGFKRFLETVEKQKLESMIQDDPTYFFNILPYAYVLGVSDKWIDRFESINMPQYIDETTMAITTKSIYTMILVQNAMRDVIDLSKINSVTMPKSIRKMSSFTGKGFGGSSGGGFSGGGSGGGGGGSW